MCVSFQAVHERMNELTPPLPASVLLVLAAFFGGMLDVWLMVRDSELRRRPVREAECGRVR